MKILEAEIKQRSFDGMWMLMVKTPDYENIYKYRNEEGKLTTYTPHVWIIADVKRDKNQLRIKKGKSH